MTIETTTHTETRRVIDKALSGNDFLQEYKAVESRKKMPRIRQLRVYLDDNNLMSRQRITHNVNAPISESAVFPYILPSNHA